MSGRWRWVVLAALLVGLVAGAGSYVALSRTPQRPRTTPPGDLPRTLPLAPLAATAPVPDPAALAAALAAPAADPAFGGSLDGEVVDAVTGQQLYAHAAERPLPPASTAKLLTAAAALETLRPEGSLSTSVVRSGDTLYLVGGGDVTFADSPVSGYPPRADVGELATRTVAALGGRRPRVRVCADTSEWQGPSLGPGWRPGYFTEGDIAPLSPLEVDEGRVRPGAPPRVADPAAQAAAAFATALRSRGVPVVGHSCRGTAPSSGFGLAAVASARVDSLVQHMLTDSDNDLAEALGRAVARHEGQPADFQHAAQAVTQAVRGLGIDLTGVRLFDTSGLSRLDRVPPRTLVELLQVALSDRHPELRAILEGVPVAGFTGTLADRYRRRPASAAAGLARAKTGTLASVNTIAGTVVDGAGRLLVFAFLTDHAVGPHATEAALDRLVGRIAAYR